MDVATPDRDLIIAIHSRRPKEFEDALARGADVNAEKDGYTALMIAALMGQRNIVSKLLEKSADVSRRNPWGDTALMLAAESGNKSLVRDLLRAGADVNATDQNGGTALTSAAEKGKAGVVRLLLKEGAKITAAKYGLKPWILAAKEGHLNVVRTLIGSVEDIDERAGVLGYTALIEAALRGRVKVVRFLLKKGADVNAMSTHGETALMQASHGGHLDVVRLLISSGADVNAADSGGLTPLMHASDRGRTGVVELLIEKGAAVNTRGSYGDTALVFSADYVETLRSLIDHGAEVNMKGFKERTALMQAAGLGRVDCVKILLEAGADVNSRDDLERTALMFPDWWSENRFGDEDDNFFLNIKPHAAEIACLLIERGADVNARMQGGRTALMVACQEGLNGMVRVLLDAGADASATSNDGKTVLDLAQTKCSEETLQMLRERSRKRSGTGRG